MKKSQFILLVAITIGFVTKNFSQHTRYSIKNGFAIGGGVTQFDIITDNFQTQNGDGWMGHMSATVDIPNKWYNVSYGMQLSENTFTVNGLNNSLTSGADPTLASSFSPIEYKVFAAQVVFLWHAKPFRAPYFTIDFGPMLQYNSDLDLSNKTQEDQLIADFENVAAKDFEDLNNVNFNGVIGATLGFEFIKVKAQYIYGFTNILGALNDATFNETLNKKFEGNQSMFALTGLITF